MEITVSKVQRFNVIGYKDPNGCFVSSGDFDAAQSELAALREELALKLEAYQGAHMMVTDLKAELSALREELAERNSVINLKNRDALEAQTAVTGWARKYDDLQQRLADAERRNAELVKALTDTREALGREYWDQYAGLDETRDILDAALTKPEEAKS
jgi:predicted  nucleic acid-binding Zn-ribbon protein